MDLSVTHLWQTFYLYPASKYSKNTEKIIWPKKMRKNQIKFMLLYSFIILFKQNNYIFHLSNCIQIFCMFYIIYNWTSVTKLFFKLIFIRAIKNFINPLFLIIYIILFLFVQTNILFLYIIVLLEWLYNKIINYII